MKVLALLAVPFSLVVTHPVLACDIEKVDGEYTAGVVFDEFAGLQILQMLVDGPLRNPELRSNFSGSG